MQECNPPTDRSVPGAEIYPGSSSHPTSCPTSLPTSSALAVLIAAAAHLVLPPASAAQVTGSPLVASGTFGFQVSPEIRIWDTRYGLRSEGGSEIEEEEPLSFDFVDSAAGTRLLPGLSFTESALADLAGDPTFALGLGATRARLNALTIELPLTASLGLTNWFTITGTVPFVRRRMEVDFALSSDGANVGRSPGESDPAVQLYTSQFQLAIDDVQVAADGVCLSLGERSPECLAARSLVTDASTLLNSLLIGYQGSLFLMAGNTAAMSLAQRMADMRIRMIATGDSAFIDTTWVAPLPFASTALTTEEFQGLITDPALGTFGTPLEGFQSRWELGDVEVGAWLRLLDVGFGDVVQPTAGLTTEAGGDARPTVSEDAPVRLHVAVGAAYRFGTGISDLADNFVDIGSGDGQDDIEVRGFGLLGMGSRFLARAEVRYAIQGEGPVVRRVSPPDQPIGLFVTQSVYQWDPGDYLDVLVIPEWRLAPELTLGARYRFHSRGEDVYSGESGDPLLPAALLNLETERTIQHVGVGLTVWPSPRTRLFGQWPVAASAAYEQAFSGSGGHVPKDGRFRIDLRIYFSLW